MSRDERQSIADSYKNDCFVSLNIDGWLTLTKEKRLGFCRILPEDDGKNVGIDVSHFEDVTARGENEAVLATEIGSEIMAIRSIIQENKSGSFVSVITDSASCNVTAKKPV